MATKSIATASVCAAALILAGCSSSSSSSTPKVNDSMTAKQILQAAAKEMGATQIVQMKGQLATSGFNGQMDLTINRQKEYSVSMTQGTGTTPSIQLVGTGGKTYFNMSSAFLSSQIPSGSSITAAVEQAIVAAMSDRWLELPVSGPLSNLGSLKSVTDSLNLQSLTKQIGTNIPISATVGSQTTVNGRAVVPVSLSDSTVDVATSNAQVVRVGQSGTTNVLNLTYPSSTTIPVPAGAKTIRQALGPILAAAFTAGVAQAAG